MVAGLAVFARTLANLASVGERDAVEEMHRQADALVSDMKAKCPVDRGVLRDSIRKERGRDRLHVRVVGGGATTTKPIRAGLSVGYDYANAVEFGNERVAAEPFFYPTYRARKQRIRRSIARAAARGGTGG